MTLLRFDTRALVKIGYMRGTPRIPAYRESGNNRRVRTIRREDRSRNRNPQRLYARHPTRMMIQSDPHGDMRRSREIVVRLRAIGGHESNSVLKVTGRCLIKIRLYAGTPENPTLLVSVLSPTSPATLVKAEEVSRQ